MNIYPETDNDKVIMHKTSVDFILRPCSKEIHIVQYDKTLPVIKVLLFKNNERYVLPDGATAKYVLVNKMEHLSMMKY